MNEHEFEPIKGLPSDLPEGEYVVWQGAPKWQSLAVRAFHVRKIAIYFFVLVCLSLFGEGSFLGALPSIKMLLLVASIALVLLACLAFFFSYTTVYTVTNRRIVLRIGIAVQMMINIPWEKVDSVGINEFSNGTGDILIETNSTERMSYIILWPHVRPWHFRRAQPLLRSLPDASKAGAHISAMLKQHLSADQDETMQESKSRVPLVRSA